MIFLNTANSTYWFYFKQYNLFYTVQKHEICPFMETVPYLIYAFGMPQIFQVIPSLNLWKIQLLGFDDCNCYKYYFLQCLINYIV